MRQMTLLRHILIDFQVQRPEKPSRFPQSYLQLMPTQAAQFPA
jgi:hypothetical protein